jgi:hypothetical protein
MNPEPARLTLWMDGARAGTLTQAGASGIPVSCESDRPV